MKKTINSLLLTALLAGSTLAQAQLYKSVGPDGKVTYSDSPPASAAKVETRTFGSPNADTSNLPYELAQAVKNNPVTLYSGSECAPCDEARKFLNTRGVPFSEKTINSNADIEKLRLLDKDAQLPLLLIGRIKQKGFESSAWSRALTAAGYPESSKLPVNYTPSKPQAAAGQQPSAQPRQTMSEQQPVQEPQKSLQPAKENALPGFRF
jgi:glutaredoxin